MATGRVHWFREDDAILRSGWSDSHVATLTRLQAYLNTQWARDGRTAATAGDANLPPGAVCLITNKRQLVAGQRVLRSLGAVIGMSVEIREDITQISWPNYAIKQNLYAREQGAQNPAHGRAEPSPQPHPQTTNASAFSARRPSRNSTRVATRAPATPEDPRARVAVVEARAEALRRGLQLPDDSIAWEGLEREASELLRGAFNALPLAELNAALASKLRVPRADAGC